MKRCAVPVCLLLVAIGGIVYSDHIHLPPWIVSGPAILWSVFLLLGYSRFSVLQNWKGILFGLLYGAVGAVGCAAGLSLAITVAFSTAHLKHPYDSGAYAVILVISGLLLLTLAILDYCMCQIKPFWLRFVTAAVAFLPCMLLAAKTMDYFEEVLSHYVS